jgi:hypothetical protein
MIGSLSGGDPPLTMSRGFDHVTINLHLKRWFEANKGKTVMLADIAASLSGITRSNGSAIIGYGGVDGFSTSAPGAHETPMTVAIRCSPRAIAEFDRERAGGPVKLHCHLSGMSYELIPIPGAVQGALADPQQVSGSIPIDVPKETWTTALRACQLSASVLIEIPFPVGDASQLDEGLQVVLDAFEAYEHGGTTAWKNTIGHIRPYLERWKDAEHRAGNEPKDGSLLDRQWKLLNARDAIHKCCHFWMHEAKGPAIKPMLSSRCRRSRPCSRLTDREGADAQNVWRSNDQADG